MNKQQALAYQHIPETRTQPRQVELFAEGCTKTVKFESLPMEPADARRTGTPYAKGNANVMNQMKHAVEARDRKRATAAQVRAHTHTCSHAPIRQRLLS